MTAREQSSILSAPNLAILHRALHNDHTYNLGAIIAHRLHINRTKDKIHCGIYATRLESHFNVQICHHDYPLPKVYLDRQAMEDHHFLDNIEPLDPLRYNLVFSEKTHDIIPLSESALFDSHDRKGYTVLPADIVTYRNAHAVAEEEPQEWDDGCYMRWYFPEEERMMQHSHGKYFPHLLN